MAPSIYSSCRRVLLILVLVALGLRLGYVLALPNRLTFPDEEAYQQMAGNILAGRGAELSPDQIAFRPPGYPYFVAAIESVAGADSLRSVRVIQAMLSALALWQVFVLAARLFKPNAGLLAALLVAVDPFEVYFSGRLLNETLFITLLLALMYCLVRMTAGWRWVLLAGICAGLGCLVKPSMWYLALWMTPLVGVYLTRRCPRETTLGDIPSEEGNVEAIPSTGGGQGWVGCWRRAVLLIAVLFAIQFLVVFPWMWRNHRRLGAFTLTTMTGNSLYESLGEGATGGPATGIVKWPDLPAGIGEAERDALLKRAAVRHAFGHPGWALRLSVRKFCRFWSPVLNFRDYRQWPFHLMSMGWYLPVMALAVAAVWRHRSRWRVWLWLIGPVLYFTLLHSVFVGSVRYRVPVMPLVCGLAGAAFLRPSAGPRARHSKPARTLSIIVPFLNEARTLPLVIAALKKLPLPMEIILVDDGSADGSGRIADDLARGDPALRVFHHAGNRGKGAAIRTGLDAVTGDAAVIQDADLEYDPQDLVRLWEPIARGETDVIYGSRTRGSPARSYQRFYWGGQVVGWVANLLYDSGLTDEPTCYKMMRTELVREADLRCTGFEFCPEITAKILRRGIPIRERSIAYRPRSFAEGKKIRWTDGVAAIATLIRYRFAD